MKRLFLFCTLIFLAFGMAACQQQRFGWNQKLTVEVDTPNGVRTGAAVVRVDISYGRQWPSGNALASGLTGEAAIVEVAPGRYLFALLDGAGATENLPSWAWYGAFTEQEEDDPAAKFARIERLRGAQPVPPMKYPRLATFADLSDPKTVKLVDPKNLAAAFGNGFALRRITLEITDEEVTKGEVEKVLGWMTTQRLKLRPTNKRYAKDLTFEEELEPTNFLQRGKYRK
jgi:hypothetical protein